MSYTGKLVLVVGASGSGKGVLIKHAVELHPEIVFPISCTTRSMRPGEVDGVQYYFLSKETFLSRIEEGDFLEWAEYSGNYYGTLKSEVLPALEKGPLVLAEIEVQGARQVREILPPESLVIIYIDAGPWEDLARRIQARAPIGEEDLEARRIRYIDEQTFKPEATYVVENFDGKFPEADATFEKIISEIAGGA